MKNKSLIFIIIVIFLGSILATGLSLFISVILPEGVVKDFFLLSKSIGFGQHPNNWVNCGPFRFKLGFFFDVSILSIIGIFISWYILRYFK